MKTNNLGNILHSINFRKLAKPAGLCIIAIFVISMLTVFASNGVQGDSAGQNFIANTGLTEQNFWTQYWTSMANALT